MDQPELNEHLQSNETDPIFTINLGEGSDSGFVVIWLRNCPLGELAGKITPGARLGPEDARSIAQQLLYFADEAQKLVDTTNE
jgi:hypothetical protein